MPILVLLAVVAAVIYGAVWSFDRIAALFGTGVALAAALAVALLVGAALAYGWRRRREVAANIRDGDWTHELKGDWGDVRLAAGKWLCRLRIQGAGEGSYIFADLEAATAQQDPQRGWEVELRVKDAKRPVWTIPAGDARRARQWARILSLAVRQSL